MIRAQASDFSTWRTQAGALVRARISPSQIVWPASEGDLFLFSEDAVEPVPAAPGGFTVSREFFELAEVVSCARRDERWALLYRLLFRLKNGEPQLLKDVVDPDVRRALELAKSVRHDIHKMHAFVRFKKVDDGALYVAWHAPEHLITELAAPFFERRFGDKPWCIFTPDRSAHWDGTRLEYGEGIPQSAFPHSDEFDGLWRTYYSSIFNPARLKIKAMKAEMSPKYWAALPEARLIPELIRSSPARLQDMAARQKTRAIVPPTSNLSELRTAASACQACPLYAQATQTVFGEGPESAPLMIVGEQPGDMEDIEGRPFTGPAGEILDRALGLAGLSRSTIYVTNAVKHFKWTRSGKRRLHQKPSGGEMHACKPWLEAEIQKVKPRLIVALGTTAGTAVLGRLPKITKERGMVQSAGDGVVALVSWHPAAILRAGSPAESEERFAQLAADLKRAAEEMNKLS